jgi:hypothetical protein
MKKLLVICSLILSLSSVVSAATADLNKATVTPQNPQAGDSIQYHSSVTIANAGGTTSCSPLPSGLVSWWQGEGNATDFTGTNNGSLQGGVVFSAGEVGQAFNLDGSSQYVRVPNSPSLNPSGSFTIDAWIYPTANNGNTIFSKWGDSGDYGGQRSYSLHLDANNTVNFSVSDDAHQFDGGFQALVSPSNSITMNAWNHVAAVYDRGSGQRSIYINGVLTVSRTDTPFAVTVGQADAAIGAWLRSSTGPTSYFQGLIDEVDFFNRALRIGYPGHLCGWNGR